MRAQKKMRQLVLLALIAAATAPRAAHANKSDFATFNVNMHFVAGFDDYEAQKADFERWVKTQIASAEKFHDAKPKLSIHETIVRQTTADGRNLAHLTFESQAEFDKFMDQNFDNMARTKTDGWLTVLVVNDICKGYKKKADGSKERDCAGGASKFPHWVTPFQRKHGIILTYPDPRDDKLAHEMGHFFGLRHTFDGYKNIVGSLDCNKTFRPLGEAGHCASCKSGLSKDKTTCAGGSDLMDYCDNRTYLNQCQIDRASSQRQRYLTSDGQTDYLQMKGLRGEPICKQDADCEEEEYCDGGTLTVGRNTCVSRKADGEGCTRSPQCESGACNVRCYTPSSRQLGESCNLEDECVAGTCSAAGWGAVPGKCVCASDAHCPAGQYCNTGVGGIGTNVCKEKLPDGAVCVKAHQCASNQCNVRCFTPASKNIGQSCNIDAECSQGKCSGTGWGAVPGKCVCSSDKDCGGNDQYCDTGVAGIGTNVCRNKKELGDGCTKGHQCSSGCCKLYNFKLQCRPSDKCGD